MDDSGKAGISFGGEKEIGSLPVFYGKIHRSNILPQLFFVCGGHAMFVNIKKSSS